MADEGPLVPPRPDPHDPAMEARLQALEAIVAEIRSALADLRSEFKSMRQDISSLKQDVADLKATTLKVQIDLAKIDGRVSQMPTLLQLITAVIAIWGMAFATLRFGMH